MQSQVSPLWGRKHLSHLRVLKQKRKCNPNWDRSYCELIWCCLSKGSFFRFRIFSFSVEIFTFFSPERNIYFATEGKSSKRTRTKKISAGSPSHGNKPVSLCTLYSPLTCVNASTSLKGRKNVSFNWKYFVERFPLECSGDLNNNRYPKHPRSHSTSIRAQSLSRAFNWKKLFDV